MKCFYTKKYTLYKTKIQKEVCILLFSDLHFSKGVTNRKLDYILKEVKRVNPDYIFISGDLIDSIDVVEKNIDRNRLFQFINKLAKISKVIISLGNHDCYKKEKKSNSHYRWVYYYDEMFFRELDAINNVYVLNNECYVDDSIFVTGITNSFEYYETNSTFINPNDENKEVLMNELASLDSSLKKNLPSNKLKFILVHSPVYMNDLDVLQILNEYDYILSGHMHNGCVPPILNDLWKSNRGIISPTMRFFAKNERNTLKKLGDKLIVNGAITTLQECSGFMRIMNFIFPLFDTVLEFKKGNEKLVIESNYHK